MRKQMHCIANDLRGKILDVVGKINVSTCRKSMQNRFLEDYIRSHYSEESLSNKHFYNIGAGNQRSEYDFWTYVDLSSGLYKHQGVDLFYDLESLERLPIENGVAEVVFNSFVIEHISIEATKNLCREAFRVLKDGGVFHSKVHCYEYAHRLLKAGHISPKVPFSCRESKALLTQFIRRHKCKVVSEFDNQGNYIISSSINPDEKLKFSAKDAFIFHNATAAYDKIKRLEKEGNDVWAEIDAASIKVFYENLKGYVDEEKKQPHQHNADYFSKEDLYEYLKSIGYSEVVFTQPLQSVSPALWEGKLNRTHSGFVFAIEAIK